MLHMILGILKIAGILLLAILLLLLLLLLIVLFVPVRYRAQANADGTITAEARATWLLHLVSVRFALVGKKKKLTVKLAGYPLIGGKEKKKRKRTPEQKDAMNGEYEKRYGAEEQSENLSDAEATEEDSGIEEDSAVELDAGAHSEEAKDAELIEEPAQKNAVTEANNDTAGVQKEEISDIESRKEEASGGQEDEPFKKRGKKKTGAKNVLAGLRGSVQNLRQTVDNIKRTFHRYQRFWQNAQTQAAYRHTKKELFYLLRHTMPRAFEADICFGLDDPAATGEVLGALSVVEGFLGNHLQVTADFEEKKLEGDVWLKGRVRAVHLVKSLLALWLNKNVRVTIRRFQSLR